MARVIDLEVDALQDLLLKDVLYPAGTSDSDIDTGHATPDNITGRQYEVVIHAAPGDGTPLLTYTVGSGITIPTGTDGLLQTTIPVADLTTLGPGDFVYYVRRTDTGLKSVVTKGKFSVVAV